MTYKEFQETLSAKGIAAVLNFLLFPGTGNIVLGRYRDGIIQTCLTILVLFLMSKAGIEAFNNYAIAQNGEVVEMSELIANFKDLLIYGGASFVIGLGTFIWTVFTYADAVKTKQK